MKLWKRFKAWVKATKRRIQDDLIKMLGGYTEQTVTPPIDTSTSLKQKVVPLHRITVTGSIGLDAFKGALPDAVFESTKWELLDKILHELKTSGVIWSTQVDPYRQRELIQATCYVVPAEQVHEVFSFVETPYDDVIKLV